MSKPWTLRQFARLAVAPALLLASCAPAAPSPTAAPARPAATAAPVKPADKPAAAAPKPADKPAAKPDSQAEWDRLVEAAKREGNVVVIGGPGEPQRRALTETFQKKYPEIKVEFTGGSGRVHVPKILAEREAGQFLVDVIVIGAGSANGSLKPQGVFDPIKPAVLLPEVLDDSKWLNGFDSGFMDKEGQFVYAFQGEVSPLVNVNRDVVPENELNRIQQLTDPRWKGRISWNDPRQSGAGASDAGHLLMVLGEDFARALLQNDLVSLTDLRQQADMLVRGALPVAGGIEYGELKLYQDQGLGKNVKPLDPDSEAGSRLGPSSGIATLANRAPHPNAAKLYLNWLLSKDGQTAWTELTDQQSRRLDTPKTPLAPDPRKTYRVINHESLQHFQVQAQDLAKQLLK